MAKQPTGVAPADDFSFDDIKLDGMGLDDQALFADLDNEMKLDEVPPSPGKKPAAGKPAAAKPAAAKPPAAPPGNAAAKSAAKPAAKPAADDLMDLDLDVTDADAPDKPGLDSLDLDLSDAGQGDELDLDLGPGEKDAFDLDITDIAGKTTGDDILEAPDVELTTGAEVSSDGELNLDGDLDLNLDDVKSTGGDLEIEGLDLTLDDSPSASAPEAPAAEDEVSLDLEGEKESPAEDLAPAADADLEGLDLNLDLDSDKPLDSRLAEPLQDSPPAQPKEEAVLDVQSLPGAMAGEPAIEDQGFEAVPDVNLDDLDLTLDMPMAEHAAPFETASAQPPRVQRAAPAPVPFVAVPDTKMPPGDVMELNLSDLDEPPAAQAAAAPAVSATGSILLTVPHQIQVRIGTVSLLGREILDLSYGSVVQLNRSAGEPVDLMLEGNRIAQGEIVLINGRNIGVRIVALGG